MVNSTGFLNFYFDCIHRSTIYYAVDLGVLNGFDSYETFDSVHVFDSSKKASLAFPCTSTTTAQSGTLLYFYDHFDSNGNNIISFKHDSKVYYLCYKNNSIQITNNKNQNVVLIELDSEHSFDSGVYLYFKRSNLEIYDKCPSFYNSQKMVGYWNTSVFADKLFIKTYRNHLSSNGVSLNTIQLFCKNAYLLKSSISNSDTCFSFNTSLNLYEKPFKTLVKYLPSFYKLNLYPSLSLSDGLEKKPYIVNKPMILFASRNYSVYNFFRRSISSYIDGFSDGQANFWLGLEYLNKLTSLYSYNLRIVATTTNHTNLIEEYSSFRVGNLSENFRLTLGKLISGKNGYFTVYNNTDFSTIDFGNKKLAKKYSAGYWHTENKTYCFSCVDKLNLRISSTIVNLSYGRNIQIFTTKMFLFLN